MIISLNKTNISAIAISVIVNIIINNSKATPDITTKLYGGFQMQMGLYKSNAPPGYRSLSKDRENLAFNSNGHISVHIKNSLDNGLIYGAKIGVEIEAKNARKIPSSIYFESEVGRIELGSDKSAVARMKITCYSIGCGTSGGWDSWVSTDPKNNSHKYKVPYVTNFGNFLDSKTRGGGQTEYSRKITYYTPEYKGWQFGISYVPDSSNMGYASLNEDKGHSPVAEVPYHFIIRNGIGVGLSYVKQINEDVKLSTAVVGEKGGVRASLKNKDSKLVLPKFKSLQHYTIGMEISYKAISLATSYSNYLKSLTSDNDQFRNTNLYGIGVRYKYNDLSTSINFFHSNHRNNKLNAATLALNYKITQGLISYAEMTNFSAAGKRIDPSITRDNPKAKIRGTLFLLGIKVEF